MDELTSCLELYEFELKGYSIDPSERMKLNILSDTPINECGSIKVSDKGFNINKRSSCDSISSEEIKQTGGVFNIKDFYDIYLNNFAREQLHNLVHVKTLYTDTIIEEVIMLINQTKELYMSYINKHKPKNMDDYDSKILHYGALIYNIKIENNEKIIIFGDFHGSFHTFLRHMFRLRRIGIISSLKKWKITNGYRIIFLGDVIDRGNYSLEILIFIMNLIVNNNTDQDLKVILNRGNHEEFDTSVMGGFYSEFEEKLGKQHYDVFINMLSILSSAVILKNEKHKYWLSHGCIPIEPLKMDIDTITVEIPNDPIVYYERIDIIKKWTIPTQIRWNDPYYDKNKIQENSSRGVGYFIYPKTIKRFLETNKIDFIIRGHQDFPQNSFLLSSSALDARDSKLNILMNSTSEVINRYVIGQQLDTQKNDVIYLNNKRVTRERNAFFGPIARITINGREWTDDPDIGGYKISDTEKIYPVITLSTNTDIQRPMNYDSFAILRFDLTKEQLKNFDKDFNVHDPRNDLNSYREVINTEDTATDFPPVTKPTTVSSSLMTLLNDISNIQNKKNIISQIINF